MRPDDRTNSRAGLRFVPLPDAIIERLRRQPAEDGHDCALMHAQEEEEEEEAHSRGCVPGLVQPAIPYAARTYNPAPTLWKYDPRAISFPSSHSSSNPTAASKPKPHCAKVSSFVPSSWFKKSA